MQVDKNKTSKAIVQAIDNASEADGNFEIPQGELLRGKIHFRSDVNLHLDSGAILLFSYDPTDHLPEVHSSKEGMGCYNYLLFI